MTHDGTKDMPCCEGENCTCKQQFEYLNAFLGVKVVVENQSGKDVKNYAGIIKGYFDDYGQYLPGEADNINARGGVLTIVIESSTGNAYTAEGYRIVNSTTFATSYEFLTSHEDADLLTLLDFGIVATASSSNAKANVPSVIRLANW
jgi:hypothetical protein